MIGKDYGKKSFSVYFSTAKLEKKCVKKIFITIIFQDIIYMLGVYFDFC